MRDEYTYDDKGVSVVRLWKGGWKEIRQRKPYSW